MVTWFTKGHSSNTYGEVRFESSVCDLNYFLYLPHIKKKKMPSIIEPIISPQTKISFFPPTILSSIYWL